MLFNYNVFNNPPRRGRGLVVVQGLTLDRFRHLPRWEKGGSQDRVSIWDAILCSPRYSDSGRAKTTLFASMLNNSVKKSYRDISIKKQIKGKNSLF